MTTSDLIEILDTLGVDPRSYHLFGPTADEGLCLLPEGQDWHVFFSERGQRYDERTFATEDEACVHLLKWILRLRQAHR